MTRGTQPPAAVCELVDERDGFACVRCGRSLFSVDGSRHHRKRRRDGGHAVENLVLLCGSGTTGCHGWVHGHPAAAVGLGLIVPANGVLEAVQVPVFTHRGWVLLAGSGGVSRLSGAEARALLAELGIGVLSVKETLT